MTRRWSLIALIVALTVALTFVIIDINSAADSGKKKAPAAGADLRGVGWWPLHEKSGTVAADKAGRHDATVQGGTKWVDGPRGGAQEFDGSTGYADAGDPVLDTGRDYSVAAWVRLDNPGFRTAVSLEGQHGSVFYLQYSGYDQRFSLSFVNVRALAARVGPAVSGRWYHLVGTYRRTAGLLSLYVNGALAGSAHADNPEPAAGHLLIGRAKTDDKPADFWCGAISDVHAYQQVLTPSEVRALAAAEPGA